MRQINTAPITFRGRFGAIAESNTLNSPSLGAKAFQLDEHDLFRVGDDVQITSLDDESCYMWGEIVAKDGAWLVVFIDDVSRFKVTGSNWEVMLVTRPKRRRRCNKK